MEAAARSVVDLRFELGVKSSAAEEELVLVVLLMLKSSFSGCNE